MFSDRRRTLNLSATLVQSWWRRYRCRSVFTALRHAFLYIEAAAKSVQRYWVVTHRREGTSCKIPVVYNSSPIRKVGDKVGVESGLVVCVCVGAETWVFDAVGPGPCWGFDFLVHFLPRIVVQVPAKVSISPSVEDSAETLILFATGGLLGFTTRATKSSGLVRIRKTLIRWK